MSDQSLMGAYQAMMNMDAWRDLEGYAQEERESSLKREDSRSASELTLAEVGEERGIRKGLLKIIEHAKRRREGI